ncbi:hypothetical protein FB451DRAFT_1231241 [Mycena latifolia]|nr:hypothetical protein FB451DRAFT_1231241 [Mycena latifolia]
MHFVVSHGIFMCCVQLHGCGARIVPIQSSSVLARRGQDDEDILRRVVEYSKLEAVWVLPLAEAWLELDEECTESVKLKA